MVSLVLWRMAMKKISLVLVVIGVAVCMRWNATVTAADSGTGWTNDMWYPTLGITAIVIGLLLQFKVKR